MSRKIPIDYDKVHFVLNHKLHAMYYTLLTTTSLLHRHQIAFHLEDIIQRGLKSGRNFEGEEDRRIRRTALDTHDRLTTDIHPESQLFLRHATLETEATNVVDEDDGRHGSAGERAVRGDMHRGCDCTSLMKQNKSFELTLFHLGCAV